MKRTTLSSMTLRTDDRAESSVEVLASADVVDGLLNIKLVQSAKEREGVYGDIGKAAVDLAVLVAGKHSRGLLERQNDWVTMRRVWQGERTGCSHFVIRSTSSLSMASCMHNI